MTKSNPPQLLNLNTAPLEALTQLPGVGPALARRIIAARPFSNVRDLILVNGVGPRLYVALLPHLTLEDAPASADTAIPTSEAPIAGPEPPAAETRPADRPALSEAPPAPPAGPPAETPSPVTITDRPAGLADTPPPKATPPDASHAQPAAPAEPSPGASGPRRLASQPRTLPRAEPPPAFKPPAGYYSPSGPLPNPAATPAPADHGHRRLLDIPIRTRWRILLFLFYGMLSVALLGLAALFYAALSGGPAAAPAFTATVTATLPQPAITAVVVAPPEDTATAPAATPPAPSPTSLPTATGAGGGGPTALPTPPAPSPTATPTATASPTAPSSPTASPSPTLTSPPTATATPTLTPRPTLAPTAPAGAGALLFAEDFDPPQHYWGVGNTNFGRSLIEDGRLQIQAGRAALLYVFSGWPATADFYYQATIRAGACGEGDSYGLQVRAEDDFNYYLFGVTCEGRARIQVLRDGRFTVLVHSDRPDPNVNTGADAVNLLAVRASGRQFQFYANGRLVTTVTDEALASGRFGLYARSFRTPSFEVDFDDVAVWTTAQ